MVVLYLVNIKLFLLKDFLICVKIIVFKCLLVLYKGIIVVNLNGYSFCDLKGNVVKLLFIGILVLVILSIFMVLVYF